MTSFHDFRSTASIETLQMRAALLKRIRAFFDGRDFFEVATPVLSHDALIDRFVEPIPVALGSETFYLQTSPEFCMKRLLASGAERIYQIAPAFRHGDSGARHNVEFTMLEWYRVGDSYAEGIALLSDLAENIIERGKPIVRPFGEAFREKTGLDPHRASVEELRAAADRFAPNYPASYLGRSDDSSLAATKDDWIDWLFEELVEPELGRSTPEILFDFPASQSQLSKIGPAEGGGKNAPQVAKRFELYADGLELANGYDELTDAAELRARFQKTADARFRANQRALPTESRLLAALDAGFPASSGCALGIDRLLMVLIGTANIADVLPFPTDRA